MSATPHEDVTVAGPAVGEAVSRFWNERGRGHAVSVDEVLESMGPVGDYAQTRATAIRVIASQAAVVSGAVDTSEDDRATVESSIGAASGKIKRHGPMPQIDGYDLVACLGAGGMGAVFEGYQSSTGRRVAVKFMLDAAGMHEASRKRFEREVEVVARLEHPGIVSVIDSGVRKGKYFYVMEYVTGKMLDKAMEPGVCAAETAIGLVTRVCDAVDYAHQRGVLHRDLKPSNVIVDEKGSPHLLDFGLAKVFDPSASDGGSHGQMGLTISGPGHLLGTLAYMSPEQARGRHDETSVRTDVYSLGAIAYELLTGRLPCLTSDNLSATLASIMEQDPPAVSSLRRGIGRDLDAVVLRALEKDPQKRYATAGEFAADLRRYLAHEPVEARRVSVAGRTWRWVQRNRAVSTVAAVALVTLLGVSAVLLRGLVRERDDAKYSLGVLMNALQATDPGALAREPTVVDLLDGANKELDSNPPQRRMTEAAVREILGNMYSKLGAYDRAQKAQSRALLMLRREKPGDNPDVADAMHNLAATLWWEGKYDQAEPLYTEALEMKRRLYQGDNPSIAKTITHLAACKLRRNHPAEARSLYDEALAMQRRLHGDSSQEVAAAINNVAKCELDAEHFTRAESLFRQALAMITRIAGDEHPGTAAASQNLGDCLNKQAAAALVRGDGADAARASAAAKDAFARALRIRKRMYPRGHHLAAASLCGMARAELYAGELDNAERDAHAGLEMFRQTRKADHPDIADGLGAVGMVQLARGESSAAAESITEALRILEHTQPPAESELVSLRTLLGRAQLAGGRLEEAQATLERALADARTLRGDRSVTTLAAAVPLVDVYAARGEPEKAAALARTLSESGK